MTGDNDRRGDRLPLWRDRVNTHTLTGGKAVITSHSAGSFTTPVGTSLATWIGGKSPSHGLSAGAAA